MTDGDWKQQIINERLGGKKDWTDAERLELSQRLDQEIEEKFDEMVMGKNKSNSGAGPAGLKDRWTEDNWEEKMAEHPLFTPLFSDDEKKGAMAPDNALTEGLAQLKFDPEHNTPEELARNYKEEGNFYFKAKRYKLAIVSFTEGLKVSCTDNELLAQLLNNRAAAYYYNGSYRVAIRDCEKALTFKPDYRKAIQKAAECCDRLGNWDELIRWTDRGLMLDPSDKFFLNLRQDAINEKHKNEKITRKRKMEEKQKLVTAKKLFEEIEKRGIVLYEKTEEGAASSSQEDVEYDSDEELNSIERQLAALPKLQPCHPSASGSKVHLNRAGEIVWPVLLVYPEYQQTDFIQHFNEKHTFLDQLEVVFGEGSMPAPWDKYRQYTLGKIAIYFEDVKNNAMVPVHLTSTLKEVVSSKRFVVRSGTPSFIIGVAGSKFFNNYLSKFKKVKSK